MNRELVLRKTERFVRERLSGEGTGHDWWHTLRVHRNSLLIARNEKRLDLFVIQLAALLHDIADWKFHDGDLDVGPQTAREWLVQLEVDESTVSHVTEIIRDLSFKGARVESNMRTREGKIVQDADRLDALGAIGVARAFAYGGHKRQEIHDPGLKPRLHTSFEDYRGTPSTSINHFHEKLLLLADRMNTNTARKIAEERTQFMRDFLERFLNEWDGRL